MLPKTLMISLKSFDYQLIKSLSTLLSTLFLVPKQSAPFSFVSVLIEVDKRNSMKKIHVLIVAVLFSFCGVVVAQDGTLDPTFIQEIGAVNTIKTIVTQNDGKTIVGGIFSKGIARLNSDGSVDPSFNIGTGADSTVSVVYLQTDGKLIVGGNFTSFNGIAANMIVRLNSNGSVDTDFLIGTGFHSSTSSSWGLYFWGLLSLSKY